MPKIQFYNDDHIRSPIFEVNNFWFQSSSNPHRQDLLCCNHWDGAAANEVAKRVEEYGEIWWRLIGGFMSPPPGTNLYKKIVIEW